MPGVMASLNDLTFGSIPRHLLAIAVLAAIGHLSCTIYGVLDIYFAGLFDTTYRAGLATAYWVYFLMGTAAIVLVLAVSSLACATAGRRDPALARRLSAQSASYRSVGLVLLITINSFLNASRRPISSWWIGSNRQGFAVACLVWVFTRLLRLRILGVWHCFYVSVLTGLALSLIIADSVAGPSIGGVFVRDGRRPVKAMA